MFNEEIPCLMNTGIDIQSYLLLMEGIKPVIRLGFEREYVEKAKRHAKALGIKPLFREFRESYGQKLAKPMIMSYYSLDERLCKEACNAERRNDRKKLGRLLGYPECCVDSFIKNLQPNVDYTIVSLKNTGKRPSFYCNNLFVFDSKLGGSSLQRYKENLEIFNDPAAARLFLIRHVPCSFDCDESIEIGKATLKLLTKNHGSLVEEITKALKNPVIYFNYFEWIILNGKSNIDSAIYSGSAGYKSLVKNEFVKVVESGDNLKVTNEKIEIFNGGKKSGEIARSDGVPMFIGFQ